MSRIDLAAATTWVTPAALQHGSALPEHVMQRLSITRRSALALLRKLEAAQWLTREGSARNPLFKPGALKQVVRTYALQGLQEDVPWKRDFAPFLAMRPNVARMLQHAFAELVNNAADHSGGSAVTVSLRLTPMHAQLLVSDDGCGLFARIEKRFQIDDPLLAMFELSKGKLTSMPDAHSGHGLYFTARLADYFNLHANDAAFQRTGEQRSRWAASKAMARKGTSIYLAIALDTERCLDTVLRSHSLAPDMYAFDSTVLPLRLLTGLHTGLESRAQAKRVVSRLGASFRRAELDFSGIDDIGHGFADELFRVFPRQHPGLELVPVGMAPRVSAMVSSVMPIAA